MLFGSKLLYPMNYFSFGGLNFFLWELRLVNLSCSSYEKGPRGGFCKDARTLLLWLPWDWNTGLSIWVLPNPWGVIVRLLSGKFLLWYCFGLSSIRCCDCAWNWGFWKGRVGIDLNRMTLKLSCFCIGLGVWSSLATTNCYSIGCIYLGDAL